MKKVLTLFAIFMVAMTSWADTASDVKYIDANGQEQTCAEATAIESSSEHVTWAAGWYVVQGSDVTLSLAAECSGDVHIILADGAKLTIDNDSKVDGDPNRSGISVGIGNTLQIYGQTNCTGTLIASGDVSFPGIGGQAKSIIINGGIIQATGGGYAAGIGGLDNDDETDEYGIGSIIINGGNVTSTGGIEAAGIGSGYGTSVTSITINGGNITATGGIEAAGIGSAFWGAVTDININGGTITADGGNYGTGIGAYGEYGDCEKITINGGDIYAHGYERVITQVYPAYSCDNLTINPELVVLTGDHGNDMTAFSNDGTDVHSTLTEAYVSIFHATFCFTAKEAGTNISFAVSGTLNSTPKLQYITNKSTWQDYTFGNTISPTNAGDKVYLKAKSNNTSFSQDDDNYIKFTSTKDVVASGNIMYLLDSDGEATTVPANAFNHLFDGCDKLTDITLPNNLTRIDNYMFQGCSGLATVSLQSVPAVGTDAFSGVNDGCTYTLALDDDSYIYTGSNNLPTSFASATYTRSMSNKWGTIIVPFAMTVTGNETGYDFYELSSVSNDNATLNLTKKTGDIAAGTPLLIRMSEAAKDAESSKYELSLSATNTAVSTTTVTGSSANGLTLTGAFATNEITDQDGYIIANNKFWEIAAVKGENKVYCAPFRAYLAGSISSGAKTLSIGIADEEETAIETLNAITSGEAEYYDLNGRRLNDLQQGVNIVKFSNGVTKKVIIK